MRSGAIIELSAIITAALITALLAHAGRPNNSVVRGRLHPVPLSIVGATGFLTLWWALSVIRPEGITRIPSPLSTALTLCSMLVDGSLPRNIGLSFSRVLVGFSFAAIIGVSIGWIAGTFFVFKRLLLPTNSFLRYIPPTAFATLLIVYFGIGESYKFSVVFVSVFFFIVQMTVDAVEDIDPRYREMGLLSGMNSTALLRYVVLPCTLPRILDILRINISGAWTFLVAAEVIGADGGVGHLIAVSQRFGRIEHLFAAIVTFGFIGILTDFALRIIGEWAFKWKH